MANFNRPLPKAAGGGGDGYVAPAAAGSSRGAGSSPLPAGVMRTRQSISEVKAGRICTPHRCIPGSWGEEELDENPAMLFVVLPV